MSASAGIFMPAFNAAAYLPLVIARIPLDFWDSVKTLWIINDGSTDETAAVSAQLAQEYPKIAPVTFNRNRGYGQVVRQGIALCRESECEIGICLHGDGQYAPEALPQFVSTMKQQKIDILQGSRIASHTALSGGMPLYKYVAGRLLTMLENAVFGLSMTDYHSGYLCYSKQAMHKLPFTRFSSSFDFDLEVIAAARSLKMSIAEIPVPTRYAGEISYLNPVTYGLRVLRVLGRYLAGSYRK